MNLVGKFAQFAQCGETYDIPISWGFARSRFFMAFVPISLPTSSDFGVATMASWFPVLQGRTWMTLIAFC